MTSFTCALTLYLVVAFIVKGSPSPKKSALIGICLGLALLSRTITIYLVPVCVIGICMGLSQRALKLWIPHLLLFSAGAIVVSGWWYLRNWIYFGDPFLWAVHQTTVGAQWVRTEPFTFNYLFESLAFLHATFWAYFGRNEFHAGITEYALLLIVIVVGVIGVFELFLRRGEEKSILISSRNAFLLIMFAGALAFLEILILQGKISSPMGRYLYMAIVPIALLIGSGLSNAFPVKRRTQGNVLTAVFLFFLCVYLLGRYWLPHYI